MSFEVKIVFDNKCVKDGFLPGFGFSALIHNLLTDKYLLFDTGGNSQVLIHNINQFGVDLLDISKIIISHNHHDHNGALYDLYHLNNKISLYIPDNIENYQRQFSNAQIHLLTDCTEIEQNIYVSGQFGTSIKEQALFLKTGDHDLILLVGCTHPGLENFILEARKMNPIKAIIGGFHGFRKYSYLNGIDFIGACHCTANINDIKMKLPGNYRKVCVGDSYSF
ncbi:MAG: MBL fold metallo-hydrolase [Promethearchaeota archaeon]